MKKQIQLNLIVVLFLLLAAFTAPAQNSTPHFGLQVGTSFSSMGSYGNMFSQSLAPNMNWDMTEKFSLQVGTIFTSSRMSGFVPGQASLMGGVPFHDMADNRFTSMTIYAFGAYQLNPNLVITGGTWFEQSGFDFMGNAMEMGNAFNPQGMMLGLDYRVNENLRFGFEVSTSRGYNPYMPGFYQQGGFPSAINRNPFSRFPQ